MDWERKDDERKWTRREWVKAGMAVGAVGAAGSLTAAVSGQLLPPPLKQSGEVRDTLYHTRFPTPQWWNDLAGSPMKVTDFKEWQGATGVWRGLFKDGEYVPGTGFPVLVIRIKRDDGVFVAPTDVGLSDSLQLYHDDAEREVRIVVLLDRCVHLCCSPGWQAIRDPPPEYKFLAPAPTYEKYGLDPVYCVCHGSQYEPMRLVWDVNPKNAARYVGAQHVHGPANRALPVVPVRTEGDVLVGGMGDPRWYDYC